MAVDAARPLFCFSQKDWLKAARFAAAPGVFYENSGFLGCSMPFFNRIKPRLCEQIVSIA